MSHLSINFWSAILAGPIGINVLMPDIGFGVNAKEYFETNKKFKVVWLLHGGLCDENSWIYNTNITRYIHGRNAIVVMPNGLNSDFANHPEFADGFNVSNFFFDELMPFVHNWLPASSAPEDNYLFGYSMGAAAAWMLGLWHPEKFAGIVPIGSAPKDYSYLRTYKDMSAADFRALAMNKPTTFPAGYGRKDSGIHLKEINMITKYDSVGEFLDSREHTSDRFREAVESHKDFPRVYLPCSRGEQYYDAVLKFKDWVETTDASNKVTFYMTDDESREYEYCDMVLPEALNHFNI